MENQNRNLILFIVISIAIYLACMRFLPQPSFPPSQSAAQALATPAPTPVPAPAVKAKALALAPVSSAVAASSVTITTDLYTAVFSNEGAVLTSFQLKKYPNRLTGKPIELVNPAPGHPKPFGLVDDSLPDLSGQRFEVRGGSKTLTKDGAADLVFRTQTSTGTRVEKRFHFQGDSYQIGFTLALAQAKGQLAAAPLGLAWSDTLGVEDNTGTQSRVMGNRVATLVAGGRVDSQSAKKSQEAEDISQPVRWTALANQFFVAALIPDPSSGATARVVRDFHTFKNPTQEDPNPGEDLKEWAPRPILEFPGQSLSAGQGFERQGRVFLGPQDYYLLKGQKLDLEKVVDFGWFGFISVYMLQLLCWFERFCHNWGVAIIFLSIVVKLILWFPTRSSYKSMYQTQQKMRELQPKLDALKRKYSDDKTKLNQETQELYAKAGVNPLGGCLPLFLQMPIFFALYATLSHSIELRGASFLWIKDLTLMDPLHVLPLFMGASMIVQQRVSGQAAANAPGQQKVMMWIFPVVLTAVSFQWPSGLLIYWAVTNLLSIVQQKEVNREIKKEKKKEEA